MSCEGYPTASNMKLLATDAQTINEVVTSAADLTTPASDGLQKTTLTGIDNKVADAIGNSFSAYIGEWSIALTFNAPNEYAVFNGVSYKPKSGTALPYVAQGADPTLSPDLENVEPFSDINTGNIYANAGGKNNEINNPQFIVATPDSSVTPPSATPTNYLEGEQIFSGWFVGAGGATNLTYVNGLVNADSGVIYYLVPNTGAFESLNDFTASVAGLNLKPSVDGVSYTLDGDSYKIELDLSVASDVFSIKLEVGLVATGHEVTIGENINTGNISEFTDVNFTLKGSDDEIVVICSGQSNALGRFGGGDNSVNANVKIWKINTSEWETYDPSTTYATNLGTGDSFAGGKNNIAFQFCKRLQESSGKTVHLILDAKGGAGIDNWTTGDYNDTLRATINQALSASGSPARQVADYFLWVQGENDLKNNRDYTYYKSRFEQVVSELSSESWYTLENTMIVAPTVGKQYIDNNGVINSDVNLYLSGLGVSQPSKLGDSVTVSTLNTTYGDADHYDGASLVDIGDRCFEAAVRYTDDSNRTPPVVSTDNFTRTVENQNYLGGQYAGGFAFNPLYDPRSWGTQNIIFGFAAGIDIEGLQKENSIFGTNALRGYRVVGRNNVVLASTDNADVSPTKDNSIGDQNTIVGSRSLANLISPSCQRNSLFGTAVALNTVTMGDSNTLLGAGIGTNTIEIGRANTLIGESPLRTPKISDNNVVIGENNGNSALTDSGNGNVVIGNESFGASATGGTLGTSNTRHVVIGNSVASNLNTDSGAAGGIVAIGRGAASLYQNSSPATAMSNVTCLGPSSRVSGDNQVQLGDSATTTYAYGAVQDRSDKRDKTDIKSITDAHIDFFMAIEWKQYRLDYREDYTEILENGEVVIHDKDGSKARSRFHIGAIAQQVESAMLEHGVDFAGLQHHSVSGGCDVYTLGYQEFIGIQGEIIQRQQQRLLSIESRLDKAGL